MTATEPTVEPASFTAAPADESMIITASEVRDLIEEPEEDMTIIDTRTEEEYLEGTIPGSVLLNYVGNNFKDGTIKPPQQIQIDISKRVSTLTKAR